ILTKAAPALGISITGAGVRDAAATENAIETAAQQPDTGLVVLGGPATAANRDRIIALAAKLRLPAIYPYRYFVASGGLAPYRTAPAPLYHRPASYIDRVPKGEKPANLPVQQPTKFELVFNLRTAKQIGLNIPESLLLRADEIIE